MRGAFGPHLGARKLFDGFAVKYTNVHWFHCFIVIQNEQFEWA